MVSWEDWPVRFLYGYPQIHVHPTPFVLKSDFRLYCLAVLSEVLEGKKWFAPVGGTARDSVRPGGWPATYPIQFSFTNNV
jgi:hypothetical protein